MALTSGRSGNVTLNPSASNPFANTGGSGTFNVIIDGGVRLWIPQPGTAWITISSPTTTQEKTGVVTYSVEVNGAGQPARTGYIAIAGKQFTITQAAGA